LFGVRQAVDYWVTVHSLKSLDGGILDQDDRLIDIVDDREQVEPIRCALARVVKNRRLFARKAAIRKEFATIHRS